MPDPILRVLTTLELLQARDRVTGAELAKLLKVDLRTVQRYIARLRELNIPVQASPGVGGSYRLRPGFRLPPLLLTNEEAFALSLGLRALRQIGLEAFAPATEGALSKLGRVLPVALRESLQTVEDFVAFEPSSWRVPTPAASLIMAASAIRTSNRLSFEYLSHDKKTSQREIEPYAVLHTDDRWYLIGNCLDRAALRTFRLDRVMKLQISTATFHRPESFNARQYLAERLPFVQSEYQIDLWIDLPIEEASRSFALWRVTMEEQDHGTRLRCGRDNLDFFAAMLLTVRRHIVVNHPPELRNTFAALARQASQAAG
jgi:predicted DNA-binding transcriptional regulator YafY